ncbi:MAG: hypothetical protein ACE14S_02340 [Candidatus Bathyarchaeia archaeon]
MVSIGIFLAATLLFINMFGQTIQTGIIYQEHRATATKTSDLLDNILLNPGTPNAWGTGGSTPVSFGIQDPEFTQYQLSPFSLMRLAPVGADTFGYDKTSSVYTRLKTGLGGSLFMPQDATLNYSQATKLLGVNGSYGFQLNIEPVVKISITETQAAAPLTLAVRVSGTGFPLANAHIGYCLFPVTLPESESEYPYYTAQNGTDETDGQGFVSLEFPDVTLDTQCYAFVVVARVGGLAGIGYCSRVTSTDEYVVPMVDSLTEQRVLIAHSFDLNNSNPPFSSLKYTAAFFPSSILFTGGDCSPMTNQTGTLTSGVGNPYASVAIPTYTPQILVVVYEKSASNGGIVLMPWGVSALAFPVTFGGDPSQQEWVATDVRQVLVSAVPPLAYQATLSVWSYQGRQVIG